MDSLAPSFCYADNKATEYTSISSSRLAEAVRFAMLNGLSVQVVSSTKQLRHDLAAILDQVSYCQIGRPSNNSSDILIVETCEELSEVKSDSNVILRMPWSIIKEIPTNIVDASKKGCRVNVIITDCKNWTDNELREYEIFLEKLEYATFEAILNSSDIQISSLTDRIILQKPNHCNAGIDNITIGPDGNFYICPSFYYGGAPPVGNLTDGVKIPNRQLLCLDHSVVCKICDAWQCRRCVWINQQATGEVGIPGHEQCVISHIEREASRRLLEKIRAKVEYLSTVDIQRIDYNDPFDNIMQ